jgi:hypothetical protein
MQMSVRKLAFGFAVVQISASLFAGIVRGQSRS